MPALLTDAPPIDAHQSFRDFVASRPDEEKWELIEGRFVMQAQPSIDHQIMAGNLDRRLSEGLERIGSDRIVIQNPAIDLRPAIEGNTYVPDVAVIDQSDVEPGRTVSGSCYLAAEIISPSDRRKPSGTNREKIAIKLAGYQALPMCEAVLLIEQRVITVTLATRAGGGWITQRLTDPDDRLTLPAVGLDCRIGDFYARTSLVRPQRAT